MNGRPLQAQRTKTKLTGRSALAQTSAIAREPLIGATVGPPQPGLADELGDPGVRQRQKSVLAEQANSKIQ
jgi:hypothetical protein|tara:strand:+ start:387 stop:599 length:213 start_codon:yes stop_codon:yes gene_type:complete